MASSDITPACSLLRFIPPLFCFLYDSLDPSLAVLHQPHQTHLELYAHCAVYAYRLIYFDNTLWWMENSTVIK